MADDKATKETKAQDDKAKAAKETTPAEEAAGATPAEEAAAEFDFQPMRDDEGNLAPDVANLHNVECTITGRRAWRSGI